MKYMNAEKKYKNLDLQLFAEGEEGEDGGDAGEDDDSEGDEEEDDPDEKKFSQKEVDDAVKRRLAREKRKWQRDQKKKSDGTDKAGDDDKNTETEDSKARRAAEDRAEAAEVRLACFEAGVDKDSIDDVTALARSYMAKDEDLDLEEAIEKVVKKYPHFKSKAKEVEDDDKEDKKDRSWGQRQGSRGGNKLSGVEKKFYELNPDLKP